MVIHLSDIIYKGHKFDRVKLDLTEVDNLDYVPKETVTRMIMEKLDSLLEEMA